MKVSIVIPTYEAKGRGVILLKDLLDSIVCQSYKDIEVVISDHSKDNLIKEFSELYNEKLNINYSSIEYGRGNSSINMNNGISLSNGEFIKIMHMDDVFCNDKAIELMVSHLLEDKNIKWGAFGFKHNYENKNHSIEREVVPEMYENECMEACSLIGCPSVSFFINESNLFDENLIIINDFDMHYRLNKKYGSPLIIPEISITIRIHDTQVTSLLDNYNETESKEMQYFKNKIE